MSLVSVTDPILLDSTGQNMATSLAAIAAALNSKPVSVVYIVSGATAFSSGWLSQYNGGVAITPDEETLYVIGTSGTYHNHIYRFNNSSGQYESLISTVEIPNASSTTAGLLSATDYEFIQGLKSTAKIYQTIVNLAAGVLFVQITDDTLNEDSAIEVFTSNGAQYSSLSISGHVLTINFEAQTEAIRVKVRWS